MVNYNTYSNSQTSTSTVQLNLFPQNSSREFIYPVYFPKTIVGDLSTQYISPKQSSGTYLLSIFNAF